MLMLIAYEIENYGNDGKMKCGLTRLVVFVFILHMMKLERYDAFQLIFLVLPSST